MEEEKEFEPHCGLCGMAESRSYYVFHWWHGKWYCAVCLDLLKETP